jgi:hypothetical protein
MKKAILLRAKKGEINFLWSDLTHILKDIMTGEKFAISENVLVDNGLVEGDIVNYRQEDLVDHHCDVFIIDVAVPIFEN